MSIICVYMGWDKWHLVFSLALFNTFDINSRPIISKLYLNETQNNLTVASLTVDSTALCCYFSYIFLYQFLIELYEMMMMMKKCDGGKRTHPFIYTDYKYEKVEKD